MSLCHNTSSWILQKDRSTVLFQLSIEQVSSIFPIIYLTLFYVVQVQDVNTKGHVAGAYYKWYVYGWFQLHAEKEIDLAASSAMNKPFVPDVVIAWIFQNDMLYKAIFSVGLFLLKCHLDLYRPTFNCIFLEAVLFRSYWCWYHTWHDMVLK